MLDIQNITIFEIAGYEVIISETIVNTWILMALLTLLAIFVRIRLTKFKDIPFGFQNVIEAAVEMFDNFAVETLGSKLSYIAPWFFMVFVFVLFSNFFSVVGLRAPTADFSTTFALALATFLLMVGMGIRHKGTGYFKSLTEPHILFFPINFVGELAKPVSLSFRLFGNILSGTIIITLYYALTPWLVQIGIPAILHAFFDVVIGALQTYIFVIMSFSYIKGAAD